MLSQWETGFNKFASTNVAPPDFMAQLMGRYLTAMNMPSRGDLAALNERLQRIENHLAHLTEQMASGPGAPRNGKTGPDKHGMLPRRTVRHRGARIPLYRRHGPVESRRDAAPGRRSLEPVRG